MEIKQSRRILILGKREAGALDIIKDLTGSAPSPSPDGSTAGLTHEWNVQTNYYTAKVPIWVDELSDPTTWKSDFLRPEAKQVIDAVGAWVFCFQPQKDGRGIGKDAEEAMRSIQEVVEEHAGYGGDCVMLAVAKSAGKEVVPTSGGEQEDICMQYGFEWIDYAATGSNEFGEKVGLERIKEALEANEWDAEGDEDDLGLDLENLDLDHDLGFAREEAEMTAELFGMKAALNGDDDILPLSQQENQVDDLDRIMGRLLAVKEQSADLPEAQRRRMAAKAVQELFKAGDPA
ncbi:uncharacterized protein RCC_05735 [Ramularia collo-cygni]|uniref:Alpha and gamma adaptin binding protein p34 n=1 Tax=Ramularia collo-cygni TaxID=112498 RepID=A0A2D3VDU7_9PEZI|nr:uncharacterized protein RCC_05735 [Ramularia collo-cygni]CZT19879.1 uncharacterized protein RCC_05735 [Ramularia collo-cygni]